MAQKTCPLSDAVEQYHADAAFMIHSRDISMLKGAAGATRLPRASPFKIHARFC